MQFRTTELWLLGAMVLPALATGGRSMARDAHEGAPPLAS
jgi:hypothetical protein